MNKIALITGATAGIGEATAIILAENSYDVIITGRRKERLENLKQKIENQTNSKVYSLCFDIRKNSEVISAIDSLPESWKNIDILVNNAGLASGLEPIQEGQIDDWEKMIDTNIKGLLYITRKVSPNMIKRRKGHIINIGSIAGKEVYPDGNIYCCTKHAVNALTKSMRIDMLPHNIRVSQVAPGMVETEFSEVRFHGDKKRAEEVYNKITPLKSEDVADAILYVATRPAHINIDDILIMPATQASTRDIIRND